MKTRLKIFTTVLSVLACCAFLPTMQAQLPPEIPGNPDGCYPAFTTAEGCNALHQLFGGIGNTAVGWYANFLAGDASFNTSVGAGTLALDSGVGSGANTALGTAAMILNLSGDNNTAVGTNALVFNSDGSDNTALGSFAGYNMTGGNNTTVGFFDITQVNPGITDGHDNTVVGRNSGAGITSGSDNTIVGGDSGTSFFTDSNNVYIGRNVEPDEADAIFDENTIRIGSGVSGVPNVDASLSACFIDGIVQHSQVWNGFTVCQVTVNGFGQLGFDCTNPSNPGNAAPQRQAMLNDKVDKLQASNAELRTTVAKQQKEMEVLTAQIKEQAAQIQKVSAQLEVSKPAPQVVTNKP
jgi:hypothetical protein